MSTQLKSIKPVIVTSGDPSGIGPEITLKAAQRCLTPFVVIADLDYMVKLSDELGLNLGIQIWKPGQEFKAKTLSVLQHKWSAKVQPGRPHHKNSADIIGAIADAVEQVKLGNACALVTNPINKFVLYEAGFNFPGHTEYLASLSDKKKKSVMMLVNNYLRVIPTTIHNSVSKIPKLLTSDLIYQTILTVNYDLHVFFGISKPRIAVCGLNPHAGEGGKLGTEEETIIRPVVFKLRSEGIDAYGPLPADSLFHPLARKKYDCVIGMYHDQVLPVVKALDFERTVNITLGLDFIRTSPDHGTAYDIAGKNIANADSLITAINTAKMMSDAYSNYIVKNEPRKT